MLRPFHGSDYIVLLLRIQVQLAYLATDMCTGVQQALDMVRFQVFSFRRLSFVVHHDSAIKNVVCRIHKSWIMVTDFHHKQE